MFNLIPCLVNKIPENNFILDGSAHGWENLIGGKFDLGTWKRIWMKYQKSAIY